MTTFEQLDLITPLLKAIEAQGYESPTPIQVMAIPPLLDGSDVLGCAQTGTGKTAAFALPILQHLALEPTRGKRVIRALVLSPTRELAAQIDDSFEAYGRFLKIAHAVIFGGVSESPQIDALRRGLDILVATPGRLLDLLDRGFVDLRQVEFFVLDEADRMLDMGFINDIRRVLKHLPADRQNLLFSATMPPDIVALASDFLYEPVRVEVVPESTTADLIEERVMFVEKNDKRELLVQLLRDHPIERALVFTRTKHGANRLVKQLEREGVAAAPIHGNKSQNARTRALEGFKDGSIPILVATDIASRGIDVDGITHVFNYDLPNEPEVYVHRIGRTGRAGNTGIAIAFCESEEGVFLRDIERLIGYELPVDTDHPWHSEAAIPARRTGPVVSRRGPPASNSRSRGPSSSSRSPRNDRPRDDRPPRDAGSGDRPRRPSPPRASDERPAAAEVRSPARAEGRPEDNNAEGANAPTRRRRRRRRNANPGEPVDSNRRPLASEPRAPRPAPGGEPAGQSAGEGNPRRRRRRRPSGPRPAAD